MGDTIKYLYERFVLRDVLSYVTPGSVVVWTTLFLFHPGLLDKPIHWLLYIPVFGFFYTVGFAVQCLGEMLGMRMKREMRSTFGQRLNILINPNWDNDTNIWWTQGFQRDHDFFEATNENEGARQGRERSVIFKQMCGNAFIAILLVFILLGVHKLNESEWFSLIVAIPLLIALFWGQRVYLLRQHTRENGYIPSP